MGKNKLVLQVPPDFMFTDIERDKISRTRWEVNSGSNKIMRHTSCIPMFGTREMWKVVEEGDFLVFIESPLDDLHYYAWNLHVMKEEQYKEWASNE